jgi:N-acetylglutamate synthase-like GNAT family acetyltransferase
MVHVRRAVPEDADAIDTVDALATATLRQTYRPTQAALAHRAQLAGKLESFVAILEDRVVGVVRCCVEGDALRVIGLGVHAECRRGGVARELLELLAALATERGLSRLSLSTIEQTGNVTIFSRLGFTVVSRAEDTFTESTRYPVLTNAEMERRLSL